MLNIPDEKLPEEFKDEERMDYLYSPFRSHSVNPKDFETKISSWNHLIHLYCTNNEVYSFTLSILNKQFTRQGRPPSCLSTVLEELVKRKELQHVEEFLRKSPNSWSGWVTNLVIKTPLTWSYNTVKKSLFSSQIKYDQVYVYEDVIRIASERFTSSIDETLRNKIISFKDFLQILNRDTSQSEEVKLLLHYLVREKCVDVKTDKDTILIKITSKDNFVPIAEIDLAIYTLENNEKLFTKCVENLEDDIAKCLKEVKSQILKGHRELAKTLLRKKHEINKRLNHKINALHNVQVLLERIKDVHGDAKIWQSYKEAISAFNTSVKETGLTEDAIEDTMLQLGEMLDVHEDIKTAISKPVVEEDDDFEQELMDLMKSDEKPNQNSDIEDLDSQLANLDLSHLKTPVRKIANNVPDPQASI